MSATDSDLLKPWTAKIITWGIGIVYDGGGKMILTMPGDKAMSTVAIHNRIVAEIKRGLAS